MVAPSHELAVQVSREVERFASLGVRCVCLIGTANIERQLERLRERTPQVLVGTPGRLVQLAVERRGRRLALAPHATIVVDEADRCLEGVHAADTRCLLEWARDSGRAPSGQAAARQFVFVSATGDATAVLQAVPRTRPPRPFLLCVRPVNAVGPVILAPSLRHFYMRVPSHLRLDHIRRLTYAVSRLLQSGIDPAQGTPAPTALAKMRRQEMTNQQVVPTIVFVTDQHMANVYAHALDQHGVYAAAISGGLEMGGPAADKRERADVMAAFRKGVIRVLVTTELVARGLDFPHVGLIVNVGVLPTDTAHYAHRAGRAGRMGRRGVVVNLLAEDDAAALRLLHRLVEPAGIQLMECAFTHGVLYWEVPGK